MTYQIREHYTNNVNPEDRGYLVGTFTNIEEAKAYLKELRGTGRNVYISIVWE
jgi:cell division septation protein DedD